MVAPAGFLDREAAAGALARVLGDGDPRRGLLAAALGQPRPPQTAAHSDPWSTGRLGRSKPPAACSLVAERVYPSIDIAARGARREELLLDPQEHELITRLRKVVSDMNVVEAMELLRSRLAKTKSNGEFLMTMSMGCGPTI